MDVFNLFGEHEWDARTTAGVRHRATAIGKRLGASLLGGGLYELPPGEKTWPYHYEVGCEEWLIAVSGRPHTPRAGRRAGARAGRRRRLSEGPREVTRSSIDRTSRRACSFCPPSRRSPSCTIRTAARSGSGRSPRAIRRFSGASPSSTTGKARPSRRALRNNAVPPAAARPQRATFRPTLQSLDHCPGDGGRFSARHEPAGRCGGQRHADDAEGEEENRHLAR